jgi:transposase
MAWRSSYSAELWERELVAANGGLPAMAVADRFDIRLSFIYKVLKRWRLTGNATSRLQRNQQELELAAYHAAIRAEIERRPDVTLEEFCAAGWSRPLASRSLGLMHNTLIRVGLTPKKVPAGSHAGPWDPAAPRKRAGSARLIASCRHVKRHAARRCRADPGPGSARGPARFSPGAAGSR